MPNTLFVDGQLPLISAGWLNDVGFVLYDLLGNGSDIPATRAEMLFNLGVSSGGGGGGGTSGNATYQQEMAPSTPTIGDLWQQPSSGLMSRWNGSSWIIFGDIAGPAAAAAQATAAAAAAIATAASTSAAAATTAIAAISSDNVLSSGEKSSIILDYTTLINEQTGIDSQATAFVITTEKTAYDGAIAALVAYLATLTTPTVWNNTAGNTTIVGTTFRATFGAVYAARQALLNRIAAVSKAVADSAVTSAAAANANATAAMAAAAAAQASADTALADIGIVSSDNILASGEKPPIILDVTVLTDEHAGIDVRGGAVGATAQTTAYDNAYAALNTYLATLTSPTLWNDLSGSTTIVGTTFRSTFAAVYSTRQTLLNEIVRLAQVTATAAGTAAAAAATAAASATTAAAAAQTSANTALTQLTGIASDNILSPGEKPSIILDVTNIGNEEAGIAAQGTSYGITSQVTNYAAAYSTLNSYLATLTSPTLWSDVSGTTTVVGTTFRTTFAAYYSTRQLLLNEIARVAGTVATWAGVSGVAVTTSQIVAGAVTNIYLLTGAPSVTVVQAFHSPDGYSRNTQLADITFTPPAAGIALVFFSARGTLIAGGSVNQGRWSLQDDNAAFDSNYNVLGPAVAASTTGQFSMFLTRTFSVSSGVPQDFAAWASMYNSSDSFIVDNIEMRVELIKR